MKIGIIITIHLIATQATSSSVVIKGQSQQLLQLTVQHFEDRGVMMRRATELSLNPP